MVVKLIHLHVQRTCVENVDLGSFEHPALTKSYDRNFKEYHPPSDFVEY